MCCSAKERLRFAARKTSTIMLQSQKSLSLNSCYRLFCWSSLQEASQVSYPATGRQRSFRSNPGRSGVVSKQESFPFFQLSVGDLFRNWRSRLWHLIYKGSLDCNQGIHRRNRVPDWVCSSVALAHLAAGDKGSPRPASRYPICSSSQSALLFVSPLRTPPPKHRHTTYVYSSKLTT